MDEEVFYGLDDDENEMENVKSNTQRHTLNTNGFKKELDLRRNSKDDSGLNMKSNGLLNQANDNIYSEEIKEIEKHNQKGKFYEEAYDNLERKELPAKRKKINLNVWGILKDAVTKDLSKFCVPGIFI